jgi:hypothetical protein
MQYKKKLDPKDRAREGEWWEIRLEQGIAAAAAEKVRTVGLGFVEPSLYHIGGRQRKQPIIKRHVSRVMDGADSIWSARHEQLGSSEAQ